MDEGASDVGGRREEGEGDGACPEEGEDRRIG